jgi:hypothetical protein
MKFWWHEQFHHVDQIDNYKSGTPMDEIDDADNFTI